MNCKLILGLLFLTLTACGGGSGVAGKDAVENEIDNGPRIDVGSGCPEGNPLCNALAESPEDENSGDDRPAEVVKIRKGRMFDNDCTVGMAADQCSKTLIATGGRGKYVWEIKDPGGAEDWLLISNRNRSGTAKLKNGRPLVASDIGTYTIKVKVADYETPSNAKEEEFEIKIVPVSGGGVGGNPVVYLVPLVVTLVEPVYPVVQLADPCAEKIEIEPSGHEETVGLGKTVSKDFTIRGGRNPQVTDIDCSDQRFLKLDGRFNPYAGNSRRININATVVPKPGLTLWHLEQNTYKRLTCFLSIMDIECRRVESFVALEVNVDPRVNMTDSPMGSLSAGSILSANSTDGDSKLIETIYNEETKIAEAEGDKKDIDLDPLGDNSGCYYDDDTKCPRFRETKMTIVSSAPDISAFKKIRFDINASGNDAFEELSIKFRAYGLQTSKWCGLANIPGANFAYSCDDGGRNDYCHAISGDVCRCEFDIAWTYRKEGESCFPSIKGPWVIDDEPIYGICPPAYVENRPYYCD